MSIALEPGYYRSAVPGKARREVSRKPRDRVLSEPNGLPLARIKRLCGFVASCLIWSETGARKKQYRYGQDLTVHLQRGKRGSLIEIFAKGKRRGRIFFAKNLNPHAFLEMKRSLSAEACAYPRTRLQREVVRVAKQLRRRDLLELI